MWKPTTLADKLSCYGGRKPIEHDGTRLGASNLREVTEDTESLHYKRTFLAGFTNTRITCLCCMGKPTGPLIETRENTSRTTIAMHPPLLHS